MIYTGGPAQLKHVKELREGLRASPPGKKPKQTRSHDAEDIKFNKIFWRKHWLHMKLYYEAKPIESTSGMRLFCQLW